MGFFARLKAKRKREQEEKAIKEAIQKRLDMPNNDRITFHGDEAMPLSEFKRLLRVNSGYDVKEYDCVTLASSVTLFQVENPHISKDKLIVRSNGFKREYGVNEGVKGILFDKGKIVIAIDNSKFYDIFDGEDEPDDTVKFDLAGIDRIVIENDVNDIKIDSGAPKGKCVLECEEGVKAIANGNELYVDMTPKSTPLLLLVPTISDNLSIAIKNTKGKVDIPESGLASLKLNSLDITTTSGDVVVGLYVGDLNVITTTGKIDIYHHLYKDSKVGLKTTSGLIDYAPDGAKKINISCSKKYEIADGAEDEDCDYNVDLKIETESGEIKIR